MGDRLISLNAAIELVCKEGTRLERNGTVAMAEIKQWCVDLLETLPSAQRYTDEEVQKIQDLEQLEIEKAFQLGREDAQPGWIPCNSDLPKQDGWYLVTVEKSYGNVVDMKYWNMHDTGNQWICSDPVCAWMMPLPKPWEGDEK